MNVSIGKDLEEYVKHKVSTGNYASASEVVRDGLRLLKERDRVFEARLSALRGEIQDGVDSAVAGDVLDGQDVMSELRRAIERKPG